MNNKNINIMVVGLGNHARRIYVPALVKYAKKYDIKITGIELHSNKTLIENYIKEKEYKVDMHYLDPFRASDNLPKGVVGELDRICGKNEINAVIISTDPLTHKMYAKWALSRKLNILMDKPITTRMWAVSSDKAAKDISKDYQDLLKLYKKVQKTKETIFSINTQRRYEIGYQKVFSLIKEVSDKFNVPVTSIQSMHADGVWIFPDEVVEQKCHPYNEGYGKCSHSGFHLFDIVWQFYKAGIVKGKQPDSSEVFTSFVTPEGTITQINQDDYRSYFGKSYDNRKRRSQKELYKIVKNYGESDSFSVVRLLNKGRNICNLSINLLHNSFSRRSWVEPAKDLYKGNGRIKHQSYIIEQGPFQCIQIHNYQSKDKQEVNSISDYEVGGNNHFDIYVFRNEKMFGKNEVPMRVIRLKDLVAKDNDNSKLYHETAKNQAILEFLDYVKGKTKLSETTSNIDTYEVPVNIMSSIYRSHVRSSGGKNPLIRFKIK